MVHSDPPAEEQEQQKAQAPADAAHEAAEEGPRDRGLRRQLLGPAPGQLVAEHGDELRVATAPVAVALAAAPGRDQRGKAWNVREPGCSRMEEIHVL